MYLHTYNTMKSQCTRVALEWILPGMIAHVSSAYYFVKTVIHTNHISGVFPGMSAHNVPSHFCKFETVIHTCVTFEAYLTQSHRTWVCTHAHSVGTVINTGHIWTIYFGMTAHVSSEHRHVKSVNKTSHIWRASHQYECEHACLQFMSWQTAIHVHHLTSVCNKYTSVVICIKLSFTGVTYMVLEIKTDIHTWWTLNSVLLNRVKCFQYDLRPTNYVMWQITSDNITKVWQYVLRPDQTQPSYSGQ